MDQGPGSTAISIFRTEVDPGPWYGFISLQSLFQSVLISTTRIPIMFLARGISTWYKHVVSRGLCRWCHVVSVGETLSTMDKRNICLRMVRGSGEINMPGTPALSRYSCWSSTLGKGSFIYYSFTVYLVSCLYYDPLTVSFPDWSPSHRLNHRVRVSSNNDQKQL